jgi:hypothetical protein
VEKIKAFENGRKRPLLLYAFGGLGALAVAIGIISLIASNWDEIGRPGKLIVDLLLLVVVAYRILASRPASWVREVLLLFYFLIFLASLALVGQAYQVGGKPYQALIFWMVLGSPLVLLGRHWMLAAAWLAGLIATVWMILDEAFRLHRWWRGDTVEQIVVVGVLSLGPLLCLGLGMWPAVVRRRAQYAGFFRIIGWLWLVGLTSLAQHLWYLSFGSVELFGDEPAVWSLVIPGLVGLALTWLLPRALQATGRSAWLLRAMLLFTTLSSLLPAAIPHDHLPVLGAISFILLWIGFALTAYQWGFIHILNVCTAVIAVRLIVAYVELFGSLAQTGVGMIIGGLLTVGLAWVWVRKSRDFRKSNAGKQEKTP